MNQDILVLIAVVAIILLAICWLIGVSKLHKGIGRIFCPIPEPEEKMMHKFCKGMARIADERETKITESNFEVIKALYNTTEDNKLGKLTDVIFNKYSWPIILAIGVFMIELVADEEKEYFLELFLSIKPWMLAVFILILAFIKMKIDREFISEEEIYRKNVNYVMWKEYAEVNKDIDVCQSDNEKKRDCQIRRFWKLEKWILIMWMYASLIIIMLALTYIPRTNSTVFVICSIICAIVFTVTITLRDYFRKVRKKWNLWEEIFFLCEYKDDLQYYETVKNEISGYNNEKKDSEITKRNLSILEASVARDKAMVILIPLALTVFSWFVAGKNISLDTLQIGSLDFIMSLVAILFSCLTLLITLAQYPKLAFIEKVVEEMKDEINFQESKDDNCVS